MAFDKLIQTPVWTNYAHAQTNPPIRMDDSTVMLSAAKHLSANRGRPFAALRACPERSEGGDSVGADFIIRIIF
jgi:hypothetical protein